MKSHTVKIIQENMLCHRCVLNVLKALSRIHGIEELDVDLETKSIKLRYNDANISRQMICEIIDESIKGGRTKMKDNLIQKNFAEITYDIKYWGVTHA